MQLKGDHESEATGYQMVETSVSCLMTRFEMKSIWSLLRFYGLFRQIRKQSKAVPGLLKTAFLIENATTFYTVSLWSTAEAIYTFNSEIDSHIKAANSSFQSLKFSQSGAHLWSAQFRLSAISPFNLRWGSFNIRDFVTPVPSTVQDGQRVA